MLFQNRTDAGRRLASQVAQLVHGEDVVVLGLPRGGMVVAAAVAEKLEAPLDTFIVRKVGVPGYEELAMGAVATGGVTVRNESVIVNLGISDRVFEEHAQYQRDEVRRRESLYRQDHPGVELRGRSVLVVDDGLATGATMWAAVKAIRAMQPGALLVAVPVAARTTADQFRERLQGSGERFVCLEEPETLDGVGLWYADFREVGDDEVCRVLASASRRLAAHANH